MKKISFIIALICLSLTYVNAQVVVDFNSKHPKVDDIITFNYLESETVDPPSLGENQIWNYTGIQFRTTEEVDTFITPPAYKGFKDANLAQPFNERFFGFVPQNGHDLFRLDKDAYNRLGRHFNRSVAYLSATDSLVILDQDALYLPTTRREIIFPLQYQANWKDEVNFTSSSLLSYPNFGLNSAALDYKTLASVNNNVAGWGKLNLKDKTIDVILVKKEFTTVDSIYLNKQPAPDLLLQSVGITNGRVSKFIDYEFYSPLFAGPVLRIQANENGDSVANALVSMDAVTSIEEGKLNPDLAIVYPNPVQKSNMKIQISEISKAKFELISYTGQTLINRELTQGLNEIEIPNIVSGIYLYRITDVSNGLFFTKQIIINK